MVEVIAGRESEQFPAVGLDHPEPAVIKRHLVGGVDHAHGVGAVGVSLRRDHLHVGRFGEHDIAESLQREHAEVHGPGGGGDGLLLDLRVHGP